MRQAGVRLEGEHELAPTERLDRTDGRRQPNKLLAQILEKLEGHELMATVPEAHHDSGRQKLPVLRLADVSAMLREGVPNAQRGSPRSSADPSWMASLARATRNSGSISDYPGGADR